MQRSMDQASINALKEGRIPQELQEDIMKYRAPAEEEVGRLVRPPMRQPGMNPEAEQLEKIRMQAKLSSVHGGGAPTEDIDRVIETMPIAEARGKWKEQRSEERRVGKECRL